MRLCGPPRPGSGLDKPEQKRRDQSADRIELGHHLPALGLDHPRGDEHVERRADGACPEEAHRKAAVLWERSARRKACRPKTKRRRDQAPIRAAKTARARSHRRTAQSGIAQAISNNSMMIRPPKRSVQMPIGKRNIAPVRTGVAVRRPNSVEQARAARGSGYRSRRTSSRQRSRR